MANKKFKKSVAVTTRPKAAKALVKNNKPQSVSFSSYFSFTDSYTSLILGMVLVIVGAILFMGFIKNRHIPQTTLSTQTFQTQTKPVEKKNTYTVKAGDDLWHIAENVYHDGYKWTEIAKANNLQNPGLITAGTELTLPKIATATLTAQPVQQTLDVSAKITGKSYTVVAGDTLWDIAVRAYNDGYKWPEIAKANNVVNPDVIDKGQTLQLPR